MVPANDQRSSARRRGCGGRARYESLACGKPRSHQGRGQSPLHRTRQSRRGVIFSRGRGGHGEEKGVTPRTPRDTKDTKIDFGALCAPERFVIFVSPLCPLWLDRKSV